MQNFYALCNKSLGKIQVAAFEAFWRAQFQQCLSILDEAIRILGDPRELGLPLLLVYNHALMMTEGSPNTSLLALIPPPPGPKEVCALHMYEVAAEKRAENASNNSVLSMPKVVSKSFFAASVGYETGCKYAIETGTFLGLTAYIFAGSFDKVDTIEADLSLHRSSQEWLRMTNTKKNINCHCGDSAQLLRTVLQDDTAKPLIFLDAHWSGGVTSNAFGISPLASELATIFSTCKDYTIVIDDARCLGEPGFPTLNQVASLIPSDRSLCLKYDSIVIS